MRPISSICLLCQDMELRGQQTRVFNPYWSLPRPRTDSARTARQNGEWKGAWKVFRSRWDITSEVHLMIGVCVCLHSYRKIYLWCAHYCNTTVSIVSELPKPLLGDLSDLKSLSLKVRREKNPTVLGYTYSELCDLDTVKVELVPEKKGMILKHLEYEVTSRVSYFCVPILKYIILIVYVLSSSFYYSNDNLAWTTYDINFATYFYFQRHKITVNRRYSDFLAFQEMLLVRFPYRMISRLPPKKAMGI